MDPSTFESCPFLLGSNLFYSSHEVKLPSPEGINSLLRSLIGGEEALLAGLGKQGHTTTTRKKAVLAQSGTDAIVSLMPWPVPGHQRLDSPSESAGCLAARKKTKEKSLRIAH